MSLRSSQTLEFDHFTLLFCMEQQSKALVLKLITYLQRYLLLLIDFVIVLWRSRCCCRRRS